MIITEIQNENQADDNCRDIQRLVLSGSQLADKIRNETNHDACGNGIGKGLVAEECRQRRAQGSRQTGCGQYAGSVLSGSGEEEGIQENDISHRHERGQTCPNLRLEGCAVFFEFEHCFHKMPFLSKKSTPRKNALSHHAFPCVSFVASQPVFWLKRHHLHRLPRVTQ